MCPTLCCELCEEFDKSEVSIEKCTPVVLKKETKKTNKHIFELLADVQ